MEDLLTIGEVAKRSRVATSALHFYDERGLMTPTVTCPAIAVTSGP